jgi:hypothetical protein
MLFAMHPILRFIGYDSKSEKTPVSEPPALLTAINLTLMTIDRRIRLYRTLVVFVIAVGLGSPTLSFLLRNLLALLGLLAIVPAVAVYLYVDKRVVHGWAAKIRGLSAKGLDVGQFQSTIRSFRHIPSPTVNAMLTLVTQDTVSKPKLKGMRFF